MSGRLASKNTNGRHRVRASYGEIQGSSVMQAVFGKWFKLICAIALTCTFGGCVLTETTISDPETVALETDFLGVWVEKDETPTTLKITASNLGHLPKGFLQCEQVTAAQATTVAYMWPTRVGQRTFMSIPVDIKDGLQPVNCARKEEYLTWRDNPHAKSLVIMVVKVDDALMVYEGDKTMATRLLGARDAILEKLVRDPADIFSKEPTLFVRSGTPTASPHPGVQRRVAQADDECPLDWQQFTQMTGEEGPSAKYIRNPDGSLRRIEALYRGSMVCAVTKVDGGFRVTISHEIAVADFATRPWFTKAESDGLIDAYSQYVAKAPGSADEKTVGRFKIQMEQDPQLPIRPSFVLRAAD